MAFEAETRDPGPRGMFDLGGRTALVTGGGSGLGFAMATALCQHGASVVLVGRDVTKLHNAVSELTRHGYAAQAEICDLLDADALEAMLTGIDKRGEVIDILINNAGIQHRQPLTEVQDGDWDRVLATNLTVPFRLARALGRSMIERRSGKIINTLSVLADLGRASVVPYAAAKGGLKMLTRGLATEFGPANVQVNGIAPGYFATEMNAALVADEKFSGWLLARTPMRRWGAPAELGGAAVFLGSAASDFVTGHVLTVDGGLTASV